MPGAANTLVPVLARREVLVVPFTTGYLDQSGLPHEVDWIAVDLEQLEHYGVAFRGDWKQLRNAAAGWRPIATATLCRPSATAWWCCNATARSMLISKRRWTSAGATTPPTHADAHKKTMPPIGTPTGALAESACGTG